MGVVGTNQNDRITRRNAIEQDLQYRLNNVIEQIKLKDIKDTNIAQRVFGSNTEGIIRKAITAAYDLGADYVDDKLNLNVITPQELEREHREVNEQTQKYSQMFWRKVNQVIHRNDVLLQTRNYEPRSPLNSNYMATVTAVGIVTTSMALGTTTKLELSRSRIKGAATKKCPKGKHWDVKLKKCVDDDVATPSALPFPPEEDPISDVLTGLTPTLALASFLIDEDEPQTKTILIWNAILDQATCAV